MVSTSGTHYFRAFIMSLTKYEKLQNQLSDVKRELGFLVHFLEGVLIEQRKQPDYSEEFSVTFHIQKTVKTLSDSINSDDLENLTSDESEHILKNTLTVRTFNILKENNICTLSRLLTFSIADLYKLPKFGRNSLTEIQYFLADYGLTLRDSNNAN